MQIDWRISRSRDQFESYRNNPQFGAVLTLARVANELRFSHAVAHAFRELPETPANERQHVNSFLLTSAILFEAIDTAKQLSQHLRHLRAWHNQMIPLFRDPAVERLLRSDLSRLRNEFVFHFDRHAMAAALQRLDLSEYPFALGQGRKKVDVYYALADTVVVNAVLDMHAGNVPESARLPQLVSAISTLSLQFAGAADDVIVECLHDLGWTMEAHQQSHES